MTGADDDARDARDADATEHRESPDRPGRLLKFETAPGPDSAVPPEAVNTASAALMLLRETLALAEEGLAIEEVLITAVRAAQKELGMGVSFTFANGRSGGLERIDTAGRRSVVRAFRDLADLLTDPAADVMPKFAERLEALRHELRTPIDSD